MLEAREWLFNSFKISKHQGNKFHGSYNKLANKIEAFSFNLKQIQK